jgi:serine phosphatase RsbU (regulator of sigma subunit)
LPTLEVGGDLYDYVAVEPDETTDDGPTRWAVTIGDVAGKGMPAALLVAGICPEVRHLVRGGVGPAEVMARVNRHLYERGVGGRFVTMAMTEIDPRSHELIVANAGHMDPLVRRASGTIEPVGREGAGTPLGVTPKAVYRPVAVALEPGDLVVLYTDGVTESIDRDHQPFGVDRLTRVIAEAPPGPTAVGEAILAAARAHAVDRSQSDDITIVCFERGRA